MQFSTILCLETYDWFWADRSHFITRPNNALYFAFVRQKLFKQQICHLQGILSTSYTLLITNFLSTWYTQLFMSRNIILLFVNTSTCLKVELHLTNRVLQRIYPIIFYTRTDFKGYDLSFLVQVLHVSY